MPCFKMGHYIGYALESVGHQTHRQWEILAVDDCGPEDGTRGLVESFAQRFTDHRVEYIRHERNGGVSAARNTAIATARGNVVAFLDPDDAWFPDHLAKSLAAFQADAEVAAVTSPVEVFWDDDKKIPPRRSVVEHWKRARFPATLSIHNFIQPSATLVRRDALVDVGAFTTTPALQHIEDYDLWIRLTERGYQFRFLDDVTSRYRKHDTAATADAAKGRLRNHVLCEHHLGFFLRAQGRLIQDAYGEIHRLEEALSNPVRWFARRSRDRLSVAIDKLRRRR